MTIKRIILIFITILAIGKVAFSLLMSLEQPQVQSRLEIYQTNLLLQASELKLDSLSIGKSLPDNLSIKTFIGDEPYQAAEKQYEKALEEIENNLSLTLSQQTAVQTETKSLETSKTRQEETKDSEFFPEQELNIAQAETAQEIDKIKLKLGLLQVKEGKIKEGRKLWQETIEHQSSMNIEKTAKVLKGLWLTPPQVEPQSELILQENLRGWFREQALSRLYQVLDRQDALQALQKQQQEQAENAFFKLIAIGGIPTLGGFLGVALLIFLLLQWLLQKDRALLAPQPFTWETPWNWEITWQVLIVGFFFISQILLAEFLPLIVALLGFNPLAFNLREKALYILIGYILMAAGGIGVLYASLKPYFPLPKEWFRFQFFKPWIFWAVGGYLVAIPLVLIVSLINQQIWQGQGGGNPIILLALQANDTIALTIFFITASVAAPIFEEIIFRGFLLPSLTRYMPVWGAIVLSSLVFAIAHLSLSELLPLTILGMVLGFVYIRSRNLLSSIFLHSLWNSGTLVTLFILGS